MCQVSFIRVSDDPADWKHSASVSKSANATDEYRLGCWTIAKSANGFDVDAAIGDESFKMAEHLSSFGDATKFIRSAVGRDAVIAPSKAVAKSDDLDGLTAAGMTRQLIREEMEAVNHYTELADRTQDPKAKEVYIDIAKEEKVHAGELQTLLDRQDPQNRESQEEGAQEVEGDAKKTAPEPEVPVAKAPVKKADKAPAPVKAKEKAAKKSVSEKAPASEMYDLPMQHLRLSDDGLSIRKKMNRSRTSMLQKMGYTNDDIAGKYIGAKVDNNDDAMDELSQLYGPEVVADILSKNGGVWVGIADVNKG